MHDILCMLHGSIGWQVCFVHRESNKVAHSLAKYVCNLSGESIWMEEYPVLILQLDLDDILCFASHYE